MSIITSINRVTSTTNVLPSTLLDLTRDTVSEAVLAKERTAHNSEGEPIVGQLAVDDAEAWARGTRNGIEVTPDDKTFHNNSKYYADISGSIMLIAGQSALSAATSAVDSLDYARKSQSYATGDAVNDQGNPYRPGQDEDCSKYYYELAKEVVEEAGLTDFTGATESTDGIHGLVPKPLAGDQDKALFGSGGFRPLPVFQGISGSTVSVSGLVPAAQSGDEEKFLKGDGSWDEAGKVKGVKGNAESTYREGNVNLTPEQLGYFTASTLSIGGSVPPANSLDSEKFLRGNGRWDYAGNDALVAYVETTSTSARAYAVGDQFVYNRKLYTATNAIDIGDTLTPGTNCDESDNVTTQIKSTDGKIGLLSLLATTIKTNIVAAINEIVGKITNKVLFYENVACSATTGDFATISNAAITADHVVTNCVFDNSSAITTDVTWTTAAGSLTLNGTCASATTATITLTKKDN